MAPRKRSKNQEDEPAAEKPAPASSRVTRSSARLAANSKADSAVDEAVTEVPKSKKAKRAPKENGKVVEVEKETVKVDPALEKLGKDAKNRTVVIEHCKQCQSFKKRAIQVQNGLENGVPGITVLLNPDKPRRGCFEIRTEDGEKFISLLVGLCGWYTLSQRKTRKPRRSLPFASQTIKCKNIFSIKI